MSIFLYLSPQSRDARKKFEKCELKINLIFSSSCSPPLFGFGQRLVLRPKIDPKIDLFWLISFHFTFDFSKSKDKNSLGSREKNIASRGQKDGAIRFIARYSWTLIIIMDLEIRFDAHGFGENVLGDHVTAGFIIYRSIKCLFFHPLVDCN